MAADAIRMRILGCLYLFLLLNTVQSFLPTPIFLRTSSSKKHRVTFPRSLASSFSSSYHHDHPNDDTGPSTSNNYPSSTPLTASQQARRDEERRALERIDDVIPGKTSALPGATDYAMDIAATEASYLASATPLDQKIYQLTEEGLGYLKSLRLREAVAAFDTVFTLKPTAYVWQAGIARYYLGDVDGAARVFARCGGLFEARFGEPASEERIWRHACALHKYHVVWSATQRREAGLTLDGIVPSVPVGEEGTTSELIQSERRRVVRVTHSLFDASVRKDPGEMILARARLRAIGGSSPAGFASQVMDKKLWKIQAWYFMGLHYDAIGDVEESKRCLKAALRLCPNANGVDILHSLPMLHMTARDWFDDDDYATMDQTGATAEASQKDDASYFLESLIQDMEGLRLNDIQKLLRSRGLKTSGSKTEAQERLLRSLIVDEDMLFL